MKRFFILLIALSMLICSCTKAGDTETNATSATTIPTADHVLAYKSIERIAASGYTSRYFEFDNEDTLINLSFPTQWTLKQAENSFDIIRDQQTVGFFRKGEADDLSDWTVIETFQDTFTGGKVEKTIEYKKDTSPAEYRYRYVYSYSGDTAERQLTLAVGCAEIDERTEAKLSLNAFTKQRYESATIGKLSALKNAKSVLILGNSFVGSSNIGDILQDMLDSNSKRVSVYAESRGFATVDSYTADSDIMAEIKRGTYDAVFICGFYFAPSIEALGVLKGACDQSQTALIAFPAHNEETSIIISATSKYTGVHTLNWKAEINSLISKGIDRWDLCYDDDFDHSTELAGYVGAHMIYRAIYGEVPKKPLSDTYMQQNAEEKLGDYLKTADIVELDKSKITSLG